MVKIKESMQENVEYFISSFKVIGKKYKKMHNDYYLNTRMQPVTCTEIGKVKFTGPVQCVVKIKPGSCRRLINSSPSTYTKRNPIQYY